jgi:hypothetical protein
VKVFASDSPATDLMVLGIFTIQLSDGSSTKMDFTARFVINELGPDTKLQSVQVWTDPTTMNAAFERAATAANTTSV